MHLILNGRVMLILVFMAFIAFAIPQSAQAGPILSSADSLYDAGNYYDAIARYAEFLKSQEKRAVDDDKLASCYDNIAVCYYKLDRYTDAIDYFHKALDLHRTLGHLESMASTLNNIGLSYKNLGNYDKAIDYYQQTVSIDEELGNGNQIAKTLNNIGLVYRAWGNYDKAIEYFERSLNLKQNLNDKAGVSKALNNLGLVYTDWKKYNQAIQYFRESLQIEDSLDNEEEAAIRINNLGRVYYYENLYDTALLYFRKNLNYQNKVNNPRQIALVNNNIGRVFLSMGRNDSAVQYLTAALALYDQLEMEGEKATVLANLGNIESISGNKTKALLLLDSSTLIALKLNLRNQLQQNYLYYSEIYSGLENYRKALEYFKKYADMKDSVFSEETLKQLSDFQIKYETEKKENEIKLLKQNETIQGLALRKQTILRKYMLAVAILLLALTGMIFYNLQTKKKDNRIIAGEKQKSDQLLLNILPSGIAQDLKEKGSTEPQLFENVTACFIDIVNFTQKTSVLDPKILIEELNQIFTEFDNIVERHSCERIKTIGDSYMAVSGLPFPDPAHASRIVSCCVDIIRYMRKRNAKSELKWEVRIGVHTGQVVAGVVGVKKYIYDVFGDTINTASRMENNSEPMRINISESTYQLIKDEFETESRGELEARGKGKLRMYFVHA